MSDDGRTPVRVSPHGVELPCRRRCGRTTILRDGRGRPLCGVCAGVEESKAKGKSKGDHMVAGEFVALVAAMREAQRRYFASRRHDDLAESKRLEREVDIAIADAREPQLKLF